MAKRYRQVDEEKLRSLCNDGKSIAQIAKEMGVSPVCIRTRLKDYGIDYQGHKRKPSPTKEELQALADEGLRQGAMAERLGVDRSTVNKWCRIYGIEPATQCTEELRVEEPVLPLLTEDASAEIVVRLKPDDVHALNLLIIAWYKEKGIERPQAAIRIALRKCAAKIIQENKEKRWKESRKWKHIGNGRWVQP